MVLAWRLEYKEHSNYSQSTKHMFKQSCLLASSCTRTTVLSFAWITTYCTQLQKQTYFRKFKADRGYRMMKTCTFKYAGKAINWTYLCYIWAFWITQLHNQGHTNIISAYLTNHMFTSSSWQNICQTEAETLLDFRKLHYFCLNNCCETEA